MSFSDLLTKTLLQSLPGRDGGGIQVGSGLTLSRFWLQSDHVRLPGHVQTPDPPPQCLPAPGQRECPPRASLHQMAACPFLSRTQGPPWPSPRPLPPTVRFLPGLIWLVGEREWVWGGVRATPPAEGQLQPPPCLVPILTPAPSTTRQGSHRCHSE